MMNVNLSLTERELELLSVSLRLNVREMEGLSKAECLGEKVCAEYREKLSMVPRILEVLATLQVKRMMHDFGCVETVDA
jgi:hypothetical protein